jgi:hypothetical protein
MSYATREAEMQLGTKGAGRFRGKVIAGLLISLVALLTGASSASAVSPQFVGLNWDGQQGTVESASEWDAIQHSGTKLFRIQGFWKIVSEHGNWREEQGWAQTYDKYFQLAAERDITMLPYLYGRQSGAAEHRFYRSNEWGEWLEFVWTFVQRYGRGGTFWSAHPSLPYKPVTNWEVWNEQNLALNNPSLSEWTCNELGYNYNSDPDAKTCVQPRAYAEFFNATSKAITDAQNAVRKAGEPSDTKVLVGGLYEQAADLVWTAEKYFGEIAKNSGLNSTFKERNSGYGLHPYSFFNEMKDKLPGLQSVVTSTRNYLNTYDSSAKPIWVTEFGWTVGGEGLGEGQPLTTEAQQSTLLTDSFNWLKEQSAAKNIEYAAWYNYKDFPSDPKWAYHCGLRNGFGEYRSSWWSYLNQTGASPWPSPAWHPDNLAGGINSDPDISSWEPGRLDVFTRGAGNMLYHKAYTWAGGWGIWENMGGNLTSGPGAVSWGPNRIDVVARATDNSVTHWAWDGSWHVDNLGGGITADPDISSWGSGRLDIFVRGTDNALYQKTYTSAGGWSIWKNLGGILTSGPSAVSWGPNRIDVVARATDNTVSHWAWDGSSWKVDNLGGGITADPDISSWGSGRLDLFVRGEGNIPYHRTYTGAGGWSNWERLIGTSGSGLGAVSWGPNRIDVVGKAVDGSVSHWAWSE